MSKYMQLTVQVRSYYPKDFSGSFPELARRLSRIDPAWAERDPSFFDIAGRIDTLLYAAEGTVLRDVLRRYEEQLRRLHRKIEEKIADWHMAEADRLLYELEDLFQLIESDLARA